MEVKESNNCTELCEIKLDKPSLPKASVEETPTPIMKKVRLEMLEIIGVEKEKTWKVLETIATYVKCFNKLGYKKHFKTFTTVQHLVFIIYNGVILSVFFKDIAVGTRFFILLTILATLVNLVLFTSKLKGTKGYAIAIIGVLQIALTITSIVLFVDQVDSPHNKTLAIFWIVALLITNEGFSMAQACIMATGLLLELIVRIILYKVKPLFYSYFAATKVLKTFTVYETTYKSYGSLQLSCSVCLQNFNEKDSVFVMPCSKTHIIHVECANSYVCRENKCPVCFSPLIIN